MYLQDLMLKENCLHMQKQKAGLCSVGAWRLVSLDSLLHIELVWIGAEKAKSVCLQLLNAQMAAEEGTTFVGKWPH